MYKRMDKMVIHLTETDIFMILPGEKVKHAEKKDNETQYEVLLSLPDITKEEFESHLLTKDGETALFECLYWIRKSK